MLLSPRVLEFSKGPRVLLGKFAHPPPFPPQSITPSPIHQSFHSQTKASASLDSFSRLRCTSYVFSDHLTGREVQKDHIYVGWSGEDEGEADRAGGGQREPTIRVHSMGPTVKRVFRIRRKFTTEENPGR